MQLFTDKILLKSECNGRHIFIDNDFLSELFRSKELLIGFINLLPDTILVIDPYIEIEFRRDVYLPIQRELKEKFIDLPIFESVPDHQEIYKKVKTNALLLSQIYAHQNEHGASLVDLMLAARLMLTANASLIITGNRRDFPSCIFDNVAILNLEEKSGSAKPFYFIAFNSDKFDLCYKAFRDLRKKEITK